MRAVRVGALVLFSLAGAALAGESLAQACAPVTDLSLMQAGPGTMKKFPAPALVEVKEGQGHWHSRVVKEQQPADENQPIGRQLSGGEALVSEGDTGEASVGDQTSSKPKYGNVFIVTSDKLPVFTDPNDVVRFDHRGSPGIGSNDHIAEMPKGALVQVDDVDEYSFHVGANVYHSYVAIISEVPDAKSKKTVYPKTYMLYKGMQQAIISTNQERQQELAKVSQLQASVNQLLASDAEKNARILAVEPLKPDVDRLKKELEEALKRISRLEPLLGQMLWEAQSRVTALEPLVPPP